MNENDGKYRWFPLFVNVSGKRFVIAGDGKVARRRMEALERFDCEVTTISGRIDTPEDVAAVFANADYAAACTSDRNANQLIGEYCRARGIPVSVADAPEESTFYFPAVVTDGDVVAGITSGGTNHALVRETAQKLREVLLNGFIKGRERSGEREPKEKVLPQKAAAPACQRSERPPRP
jgi:glutamyl-tRNA reductase